MSGKRHMTVREKFYMQKVSIHHKFKYYLPKNSECTYLHTGLLGDGYLPRPHPSRCFAARPRRYVPQLKAFSISFIHYQPYWKSPGISFGLESDYPVFHIVSLTFGYAPQILLFVDCYIECLIQVYLIIIIIYTTVLIDFCNC